MQALRVALTETLGYWTVLDGTWCPVPVADAFLRHLRLGADRAEATTRINTFAAKWQKLYPAAVECLTTDVEHLTTYLRFPKEHWPRNRHSNFIERTFGETRRRVKVIGRLPGERSCLSLVWAVLDRASRGWRGVEMTPKIVRQLQQLRHELLDPPREQSGEEVVHAAVTAAA